MRVYNLASTICASSAYEPAMIGEDDVDPDTGYVGSWTLWVEGREYLMDYLVVLVHRYHDIDIQQWLVVPGRDQWVRARFGEHQAAL